MNNQWDSWLENQQKALNWWADMTKQMGQQPTQPTSNAGMEALQGWWKNLYEQQQRMAEELLKNGSLQQIWEKSPELLQRWTGLQQEWAQQWSKMSADVPAAAPAFPWAQMGGNTAGISATWSDSARQWQNWLNESNKWISSNIMGKLPENMRPHLGSFMESYQTLYKYWEPIQKMIMFNLSSREQVNQYFSPDSYREWIGGFFGMKMPVEPVAMLESVKDLFDKYIKSFSELAPDHATLRAQWMSSVEQMRSQGATPAFQAVMDISSLVNEGMERIFHVITPSREIEMAQTLKDIQFNYLAFMTRTAELQSKVYEAGQFALPDTIRYFYNDYLSKQAMPDYQAFYKHYLDVLEDHVLEVLNGNEYSLMQAEVAKLGVTVKAKLDKLVELAFSNQPFLMKSFADEAAQEMTSLRRKLRLMEQRLADMEARLGVQSSAEPVPQTAPAAQPQPAPALNGAKDDFTTIEGIGAKISEILYANGIATFQSLAQAQTDALNSILAKAGSRYRAHDPSTWPEQAKLAAQGRWDELKVWQDQHKNGKR